MLSPRKRWSDFVTSSMHYHAISKIASSMHYHTISLRACTMGSPGWVLCRPWRLDATVDMSHGLQVVRVTSTVLQAVGASGECGPWEEKKTRTWLMKKRKSSHLLAEKEVVASARAWASSWRQRQARGEAAADIREEDLSPSMEWPQLMWSILSP